MSARDDLRRYVGLLTDWWTSPATTEARTDRLYGAISAEALAAAADDAHLFVPPSAAAEVAEWLRARATAAAESTGEKDTHGGTQPPAGESTARTVGGWPAARAASARLGWLLDAIRTADGEWTTHRVVDIYRGSTLTADTPPDRLKATARGDLRALHDLGHLAQHDHSGHRHYTLLRRDDRE